jgi:hypothetical protein
MASAFLTKELVEQAVGFLKPGIEALIRQEKKVVIYIVVLDPAAAPQKQVLWEAAIGNPDKKSWPRDYAHFAHAKAELTLRTGLPAHLVLRSAPHLYREGDFKFGGSDTRHGIIVAASGLDWQHDLMVCGAVISMCYGLVLRSSEAEYAKDTHFIGEK